MKQVLNVALGVLAGFVLAGVIFLVARVPGGDSVTLEPAPTQIPIAVQVSGAVLHPGVYTFADGARVQDAIAAAGGLLAEADPAKINQVAKLEDAQQIAVPYLAGMQPTPSLRFAGVSTPNSVFTVITTPTDSGSDTNSDSGNLIDINSASVAELDTLPGIGPALAQRIVDYRDENGPFTDITEIENVPGIGDAIFNQIQDLIVAN